MGMFDYIRSSYDLGEQFTNVVCQTKDIEYGIGGTMNHYWIDPIGRLWRPDYVGTSNFVEIDENDSRYNKKLTFLNFEWIPTGKHGKYQVHTITNYVNIYPEKWNGRWEDWPTLRLHFVCGILKDYERIYREHN